MTCQHSKIIACSIYMLIKMLFSFMNAIRILQNFDHLNDVVPFFNTYQTTYMLICFFICLLKYFFYMNAIRILLNIDQKITFFRLLIHTSLLIFQLLTYNFTYIPIHPI